MIVRADSIHHFQFIEEIPTAKEDVEAGYENIHKDFKDAESACSGVQQPEEIVHDPQLPVKQLLNFHRIFRSSVRTEKEKEPLMEDLDPVREFYRKLELDRMYQEVSINNLISFSFHSLVQKKLMLIQKNPSKPNG